MFENVADFVVAIALAWFWHTANEYDDAAGYLGESTKKTLGWQTHTHASTFPF